MAAGRAEATGLFGNAPSSPDRPVATAQAVEEWASKARPGDTFVYHSGAFLVKSLPAVLAATRLFDAGEVNLFQQRLGPSRFDYCMQKRRNAERRPLSAAAAGQGKGRSSFTVDDEEVEQLMAVLRRLANFAKPCPSYRELAQLAQLAGGPEAARYRLKLLVKAERIRITEPDEGPLVITIVSSGRSTARCAQ